MRQLTAFFLTLAISASVFAQTVAAPPAPMPAPVGDGPTLIRTLVESGRDDDLRWPDFSDYRKHLVNFYGPTGYTLAWTRSGRPTPQTLAIIALLETADVKGINSFDYDGPRWPDRLRALEAGRNELAEARFDLAVSVSLMRYISDLHIGRINPRNLRIDLDIESKKYYLPTFLTQLETSTDPGGNLAQVEPPYEEYRRLQNALARYRLMAADMAGVPPLTVVKSLKPGTAYNDLPQLAKLLTELGDLPAGTNVGGNLYAEPVVTAVKRFQRRNGLTANGILGERTFKELNKPIDRRILQIELALERMRWYPADFDAPPIIVNIPEFVLRAWSDTRGKTGLTMDVVVGKAYGHETPVFADVMKYVIFRPYWNVPPSIQRNEVLPKLTKNAAYLDHNHYELVDDDGKSLGTNVTPELLAGVRSGAVHVRQKPGPDNSLGLVKFIFPNENNIYFHSTPAQSLFGESRRDFSHGCIRVEEPARLASWVLRDKAAWTPEKIKTAMTVGPDDQQINLTKGIPILITYTTAIVLEDGEVRFFDDIYGLDEKLENALAAGYPYPA